MQKFARYHKKICNYEKSTFNVDIGDIEVEYIFIYFFKKYLSKKIY